MIIQINDEYQITSDSQQWTVRKKMEATEKNPEQWKAISYHSNFESALTQMTELRIRLINSKVPDEILKTIQTIKQQSETAAKTFTL